ncbi:nucleotidyltransferase domain-containing protein [Ruminococcus flavefaciens]|uniref:Nucleotidyltransferase domain-containing protein n=1 Tax=Ruminococcus flavefaciens TaxID=1265 RepID=A0A1M7GXC5_RUMFL|nr:nucleotidyltransferase domain-containing protein [Ruminococcus flavefaciens]SHM21062.1 Nucleotidyltransferase domain-containing protein [Ruminococcus flavefaciens]
MIDTASFIDKYISALKNTFPDRICFVGLQGSYARGEATESSDIDFVVILDNLSCEDVRRYRTMLDALPYRELFCGFLSDADDLRNWDVSDLFQFYHDTKPIIGTLDDIVPSITDDDIRRSIKIGVCNIYHSCVHNLIYEKDPAILKGLYKSTSFVIQALWYLRSGEYSARLQELFSKVEGSEKDIISAYIQIKNSGVSDFERLSDLIFNWSKKQINQMHEQIER